MEPRLQPVFTREPMAQAATTVAEGQNRVLRNTYWLLALSMLPTVAGAWFGMQMNFAAVFATSPIMAPLLMFGVMIGALFGVTALRNSAWGVPALFGFTFIAGLMLAPILSVAVGFRNGGQLVALAGGMTAAIFFAMAGIATVTSASRPSNDATRTSLLLCSPPIRRLPSDMSSQASPMATPSAAGKLIKTGSSRTRDSRTPAAPNVVRKKAITSGEKGPKMTSPP
jgi:hypothetical protein